MRDEYLKILRVHQPSRLCALIGVWHCRDCGRHYPCLEYEEAANALARPSAEEVATRVVDRQPAPVRELPLNRSRRAPISHPRPEDEW